MPPTLKSSVAIAARSFLLSLDTQREARHVRTRILESWPFIVSTLPERMRRRMPAALPKTPRILGSSVKVDHGAALNVRTAVVYLSPASEAGVHTCPNATASCAAVCLGHSAGRMVMSPVKRARLWKTGLLMGSPIAFGELLALEVRAFAKRCLKEGSIAALRFDGSSDTGLGDLIRAACAEYGVQVYDYTKDPERAGDGVTFSHSGAASLVDSQMILRNGGSVAVVFATKDRKVLPATWQGFPVIDGDESDARFLDRERFGIPDGQGYVVGLTFKGPASSIRKAGEFAQPV